ncbi:hypothetical protein VTN49DRAFT_5390 [Thermomyces lanuginosus]|uniref:uncharacterized protein n=1 Tax=Thermomyces lanuginosus TaxID=5541 RepID=UPI003742DC00
MSVVSLLGVKVLNNPAPFLAPYEFEITFECLEQLQKDLEWKLTYVGSATSSEYDQELDSLLVGPIPVGVNKFIFEADPPDLKRIPPSEILGVTVILLTCSYDGREFVRVGYYVNNEYDSDELNQDPPPKPIIERVRRNVLAEKPRVTRFAIKWDSEESAPAEYPPEQPDAVDDDDDGENYGAEERELEEALMRELEEAEREAAEDDEMDISDSEAGSEDIENESELDDEDLDEEEVAEVEGDEDIEIADDDNNNDKGAPTDTSQHQQQPELMVH